MSFGEEAPLGRPTVVKDGAPWALIAVMGVTGAGKSTFIREVSGDQTVVVGDGLESCIPGFNDTWKTETEVLHDVSKWLKETYEKHNKLSGIIYLHGLNHARVERSALRNLKMFRELCGEDPLKNAVLATTFWDTVTPEVGERREKELSSKTQFWGGMLEHGSRMARFTDRDSGLAIIRDLMHHNPKALKIQHELVKDGKTLIETGAGQVVNEELARLEKKHLAKVQEMQEEMEDALLKRDFQMHQILEEQSQQLENEIDRVHRQQEQLRADRRDEHRRLENEFENAMYELQVRNSELTQNVEFLQNDVRRKERERTALDQRLVDVERYNQEVQKKWDGLDIDGVIAKIRAEESKLRTEEREKLEAEIAKLQKSEVIDKKDKKAKGTNKAVKVLFGALRVALPLVSMFTLGIPIALPAFSSGGAGS